MKRKQFDESRLIRLNELYKVCNKLFKSIVPQLEPYIGKKIIKADNTFLSSVNIHLPETKIKPLTDGGNARVHYLTFTFNYMICLKVCVNFWGGSYEDNSYYCYYEDNLIVLGEMDNQDLKSLNEYTPITTINIEQQRKLIQRSNKLYDQLMDVNNKIRG